MNPMTDDEIVAAEAVCEKASPGPWFWGGAAVHSQPLVQEYQRLESAMPTDAPDEAYDALPDTAVAFVPVVGGDTPTAQGAWDAAFIALARTALPRALAEVRRLREEVARLEKEARWTPNAAGPPTSEEERNGDVLIYTRLLNGEDYIGSGHFRSRNFGAACSLDNEAAATLHDGGAIAWRPLPAPPGDER